MKATVAEIDAVLPQTQCGLCGFNGCLPYAAALHEGKADINLCPPGGVHTLAQLGRLLEKNPAPFVPEFEKNEKKASVAIIRESECIGCTKCIQACPVDAILGASKAMHTVITDECTGCGLCVPPCPVDCIDLKELESTYYVQNKADQYRIRYESRNERLELEKVAKTTKKEHRSGIEMKDYIKQAIERAKRKKTSD